MRWSTRWLLGCVVAAFAALAVARGQTSQPVTEPPVDGAVAAAPASAPATRAAIEAAAPSSAAATQAAIGIAAAPASAPANPPAVEAAAPVSAPATQPAIDADVAAAIANLGVDDFDVREAASKRLWSTGRRARAALEKAAESPDPEISGRARKILNDFNAGITPATPAEQVAAIIEYPSAADDRKNELIAGSLNSDSTPPVALLRLAHDETDEQLRENLQHLLVNHMRAYLPQLIVAGQHDVDELFAAAERLEPGGWWVHDYAVYLTLKGQARVTLAALAKAVAAQPKSPQARLLLWLYYCKGDLKSARAVAAGLEDTYLQLTLAQAAGDWAAAEALDAKRRSDDKPEPGARLPLDEKDLEAASRYFAHRHGEPVRDVDDDPRAAFNDLRAAAEAAAAPRMEGRPWSRSNASAAVMRAAQVFLLLGRPAEAEKLLQAPQHRKALFDLLVAQDRADEALAVYRQEEKASADGAAADDQEQAADANRLQWLRRGAVGLCVWLGDTPQALEIIGKLRHACQDAPADERGHLYGELVALEHPLVLKDPALAAREARDVAEVFGGDGGEDTAGGQTVVRVLFPDHGDAAVALWPWMRRAFPDDVPAATCKRMAGLFHSPPDGATLSPLAESVCAAAQRENPIAHLDAVMAVADLLNDAAQPRRAQEILERFGALSGNPAPLTELADRAFKTGDYAAAARWYARAADLKPADPAIEYLWGYSLLHGGQEARGRERLELANLLPVGDESARFGLLLALNDHKFFDDCRRQADLILRTGEASSWYYHQAQLTRTNQYIEAGNFSAAADEREGTLLMLIDGSVFLNFGDYVRVPSDVHRLRAMGLLKAGDFDGALREAKVSLACWPQNIETVIDLVGGLESHGRGHDADELFDQTLARLTALLEHHDHCASAHNSVAWLCACCHRKLDLALEHARRAVALAPDEMAILDTLAETQFHRGVREEAVALEKRCVEKRDEEIFRKHLANYESAPIPTGPGE